MNFIAKKEGLKSQRSWNLIQFGLRGRVLRGDRAILSVKPYNTRRIDRKCGLDELSSGITLEPPTKPDKNKKNA